MQIYDCRSNSCQLPMSADAQRELCRLTATRAYMDFHRDPTLRHPWPSAFFGGCKVSFTSKLLCG